MAKRNNRTAGHNYERSLRSEFEALASKYISNPEIFTARAESRNMDNRGVDIFGPSIPFHIQAKNSVSDIKYSKYFLNEELPKDKPLVLIHKKTKKSNTRFVKVAEYAVMPKEFFIELLTSYYNENTP
jgi:hypothetical protein